MSGSRLVLRTLAACAIGAWACAPAQPPPAKPAPVAVASSRPVATAPALLAEEAEPAPPELRTGRIVPIEHAEPLQLRARRHTVDGDEQLLEVTLPDYAAEVPGDSFWNGTEARINGSTAPFQLVSRSRLGGDMALWLRRPKSDMAAEIMGDVYTPSRGAEPGHHFRLHVPAPTGAVTPELPREWAEALAEYLEDGFSNFGLLMAPRLRARYQVADRGSSYGDTENDLAGLLESFRSDATDVALRRLKVLAAAKQAKTVPMAKVTAAQRAGQPWAELAKRLAGTAPEEPLAKAVPADFYFVRAKDFASFADAVSYGSDFGSPLADLFDGWPRDVGTLNRYVTELGVETGELSRTLGREVVQDFAAVGSDPYLREGSDVTLVFRLRSPLLFEAARLKSLATYGAAHGGLQTSSFAAEGVTVDVARSADGRVRQHHAVMGELSIVSNSPGAIKRVIAAIAGKAPRLADEADFRYALLRDANVPADVLSFVGERFVANLVGPAQKIGEMRRQIARAELLTAPNAALLFGWVHGKSPTDKNELLRAGLLLPADLKHLDGVRIDWTPGAEPRSTWGAPARLEPLIDLPAISKVSVVERDAYAKFAQRYEYDVAPYWQPLMLRATRARRGEARGLHAELRLLPLVAPRLASRFDLGGDGRVAPTELVAGVRLSLGLGHGSPLREELTRSLGWAAGGRIQLDWLGDYVMVGAADRNELLTSSRALGRRAHDAGERPASPQELGQEDAPQSEMDALPGLPVYAIVGLRSRVATAVALAAARQLLEGASGGAVEWAPFASHRGVEVVRVFGHDHGRDIALYYALAGDHLLVTFNRSVMRSLIEQALDNKLPSAQAPARADAQEQGQVVMELAPSKKGALHTVLSWVLNAGAVEGRWRARSNAEAVLRGVPESAHKPERSAELMLAYLGEASLTPDGRRYSLTPQGIADPLRGTAHAPEWPPLPTPESTAERILSAFSRARADLSFDEEPQLSTTSPKLRSIRVRTDLWLR